MLGFLRRFFKVMFCRHNFEYWRPIYGDEINVSGGHRAMYRCTKCEWFEARD